MGVGGWSDRFRDLGGGATQVIFTFGDPRVPARIWNKIQVHEDTGCWVWTASLKPGGYGQVHYKRRTRVVHRLLVELLAGPVPDGLDLDHLCRVRACANPAHLEAVDRGTNLRRGVDLIWMRRAAITHCPQGHPYAGENLGYDSVGRRCRTCDRRRSREHKARKRGMK